MKELDELRTKLDGIDKELMRLYAERMETAEEIGAVKRLALMDALDPAREEEVVSSRLSMLPERFREGGERLVRLLMNESKRVQKKGLNLYLVGMPDCGKTRMGRKLAAALGMGLCDTDRMIMNGTGMTIDEIFASMGEEGFRTLETEALKAAAAHGGLIVATGGGMPMREENAKLMRYSGVTVFLDRALDKLHGQATNNRPLLAADTPEEVDTNIDRLYHERYEKYEACADIKLDPDAEGAAERAAGFYLKTTGAV